MINSIFEDIHFPEYVFTYPFEKCYLFEIPIIVWPYDLLNCLRKFLSHINEDTFFIKHRGEIRLNGNEEIGDLYIPSFKRKFSTTSSIDNIFQDLIIYSYGEDNQHTVDYLEIGWDGIIEGERLQWSIHFERPFDLVVFGVRSSHIQAFEDIFLSNPFLVESYITEARAVQAWAFRREEDLQKFMKNYGLVDRPKS